MSEPTIACPKCKTEIKLTESLAGPLIESTRREYEQRMAARDANFAEREKAIQEQQAEVVRARQSIEDQVAAKLKIERASIASAEAKKAREALADELAKVREDKEAIDALLKDRDAKLAEARKNELELRQARQQLQEEKDQFELDKQRAIDAERAKIRATAQKDADEQARLLYRDLLGRTKSDPRQAAWDALTRAEENWRTLKRCESAEAASKKLSEDADALRAAFIQARDGVLTDLYNSVRDRFVSFYKQVHAPDEGGFTADIRPTDAGIELEVDFYGDASGPIRSPQRGSSGLDGAVSLSCPCGARGRGIVGFQSARRCGDVRRYRAPEGSRAASHAAR
jgi:DNA repair exonuclease SbcCD ATPase subunit